MWTNGAVYARATVTRVTFRGKLPNEVLTATLVKMECEGCPDDGGSQWFAILAE